MTQSRMEVVLESEEVSTVREVISQSMAVRFQHKVDIMGLVLVVVSVQQQRLTGYVI